MRISESVSLMLILTGFLALAPAGGQKQMPQSPRILFAKTIYFDNETGSDAVGKNALAQLKKWGKFQLVTDRKQADLVLLLSADPYKGGNVTFASGQTGSVENGHVTEDAVPNYNKQSPTRYAYLTVIDRKTGDNLWSDKHLWGGLLTGFNSVGERLIKELEGQISSKPRESFISPDGNFAFKFPNSLVRCERDSKQADRWMPAESCESYIPVCSDFSGSRGATIACVAYPPGGIKGTNFQAAALSVNETNATTPDGCLNVAEANVRTLRKEEINGVTFTVIEAGGVAAGNLMDGEAYRSFHQNKCYELDIRIASSNIGNYDPGTVREFGRDAVYRNLKSVLNTFRFVKQ